MPYAWTVGSDKLETKFETNCIVSNYSVVIDYEATVLEWCWEGELTHHMLYPLV